MIKSSIYIGIPINRTDGPAKVKGEAKYAGEFNESGLTYGFVVSSTIAKGKIINIDTSEALKSEGVLQVFTHKNVEGLARLNYKYKDMGTPPGHHFRFLQTGDITFSQQPVALVVAETFEQARFAATLVRIEYKSETPVTDLFKNLDKAFEAKGQNPKARGNFKNAFSKAEVQFEAEYFHSPQHHNPLEMHASTVLYKGEGKLIVYDKTQSILNSQSFISGVFGLSKKMCKYYHHM